MTIATVAVNPSPDKTLAPYALYPSRITPGRVFFFSITMMPPVKALLRGAVNVDG